MAVNTPFLWGSGGRKLTPEEVERRREIENAILSKGVDFSPVADPLQGLGRVANAAAGAFRRNRLGTEEEEIGKVNQGLIASLLGGGSPATSAAPVSSSAIPMTSAAGEMAATAPGSATVSPSGVLPASFLGAVDTTEGGGGYDTLYGHAQRNKFAGTDVSAMPIRDVIAFTDPSGPYAQTVKSQIGRVATPVGRHQIVGTTLRSAVADLGLDPNAKFDAATQDRIALHLAKNRVASADTMGGKIAALRSEWHGFKGVPDAQMQQIVADIEQAPVNVASISPQTATDAIEAVAPLQPTEAAMTFAGQEAAPPVSLSDEVAAYQQTPEYAAAFPGRAQPSQAAVANAMPVQVAGGGDRVPMANTGINSAIIEALSNPQATPQTQRLAAILMEQEQRRAMAQEEQRMQAADPMRQLQLEKGRLELEAMRNPGVDGVAVGNRIVDRQTGKVIYEAPEGAKAPDLVDIYDQQTGQPYKAQWNPETKQFERVGGIKAPSGTSLTVSPDGQVSFSQGGSKPLTENQSKLTLFQSLQTETQPVLLDLESQFNPANIADAAARSTPIAGNFFQSEQGQIYSAASTAWAEGALRIATGAAATPEEMERTKRAYFAQPGDTPNTIAFKAQMREMYNRSIDRSLGKKDVPGALPTPSDFAKKFDDEEKAPEGVDASDWEYMTPEERKLFQ